MQPYDEDTWSAVQFAPNAGELKLVARCVRCLVPNIDVETGERDKAVPFKVSPFVNKLNRNGDLSLFEFHACR